MGSISISTTENNTLKELEESLKYVKSINKVLVFQYKDKDNVNFYINIKTNPTLKNIQELVQREGKQIYNLTIKEVEERYFKEEENTN